MLAFRTASSLHTSICLSSHPAPGIQSSAGSQTQDRPLHSRSQRPRRDHGSCRGKAEGKVLGPARLGEA
ncbi:hypothetical protein QC761_0045180 [Podospora bellae-mahoneyi]|uniref:Uncharacterized protein n=1 Tax=Podospora bellae-mahoneyi TaxID=2093777 RepID=A0ABR0FV23_9PEZI|nr:hypothetical protein QC761_0045180 [Podospora bellae-mahoneyi]